MRFLVFCKGASCVLPNALDNNLAPQYKAYGTNSWGFGEKNYSKYFEFFCIPNDRAIQHHLKLGGYDTLRA